MYYPLYPAGFQPFDSLLAHILRRNIFLKCAHGAFEHIPPFPTCFPRVFFVRQQTRTPLALCTLISNIESLLDSYRGLHQR